MRRRIVGVAALALVAAGCGSGTDATDAAPDAAADAALPAECGSLVAPASFTNIVHIPASEDFVLDADGFAVGISQTGGNLIKTAYTPGTPTTIAPNVSSFGRGTRILPGGDIVVAEPDSGSVLRFAANGSSTPIASVNQPNGIAVDQNGIVYLTSQADGVVRIDPDSLDVSPVHQAQDRSFDGIAFSPDFGTLYFNEESGQVYSIAIGPSGPTGAARPYVMIEPSFLLDGMTTDLCGNLYIIEMSGQVWRYTLAGALELWLDLTGEGAFVPALNFGSGVGGWKADSIYVMDFNGGLFEADLGIGGRVDPHLR